MSDNGRYYWNVCSCGIVTDLHQTKCPMSSSFVNVPHKLKKVKISTEDFIELIQKRLVVVSNHTHPQIKTAIQNKRPPSC